MRAMNMKTVIAKTQLLPVLVVALALLLTASAYAAAPGITGTSFSLTAGAAYTTQPDGALIYTWGYGCTTLPPASAFLPAMPGATCPTMQLPGPTLIVNAGGSFTVTLTNNLPAAAGNTSILFPGFAVTTGVTGVPGPPLRVARTLITVEPKAICRSRWASTERSLCSRRLPIRLRATPACMPAT